MSVPKIAVAVIAIAAAGAARLAAEPPLRSCDGKDKPAWCAAVPGDRSQGWLAQRRSEVDGVVSIVRDEVNRFAVAATALQAAPLVGALRERAELLRRTELDRYERQLGRLDPDQRELVEMITRGVVAKLLHEPSVRLRDQAGSPRGERNAAAVVDLFDLG